MAPRQRKQLGVGAQCTVQLRYLHPKDNIHERIPNQTSNQKLESLIVQAKEERLICKEPKLCIVFRHEDFGGQPLWCLPKYLKIDDEGPSESFFEASDDVPPAGVVGGGGAGQGGCGDNDNNPNLLHDDVAADDVELPANLQRMMDNPSNMDEEDISWHQQLRQWWTMTTLLHLKTGPKKTMVLSTSFFWMASLRSLSEALCHPLRC